MMTLKKLTAENNSILNLIFWSDNFYSLFVQDTADSMWPSDHTPLTCVTLHTLQDALKVVMLNIWANAQFNDHDKVKIVCPHLPSNAYYMYTHRIDASFTWYLLEF